MKWKMTTYTICLKTYYMQIRPCYGNSFTSYLQYLSMLHTNCGRNNMHEKYEEMGLNDFISKEFIKIFQGERKKNRGSRLRVAS